MPLLNINKLNVIAYLEFVDMRKSFDALHSLVKGELQKNIFEDQLVLFINKTRDKAKVLYWDGTGLVIFYKRLEQGKFTNFKRRSSKEISMTVSELQLFLEGTRLERNFPLSADRLDTRRLK